MLRYPPFNVQVVDMEKKRCRGLASNSKHGGSNTWPEINVKGIHAAGTDPRGLGIMQPWGALPDGNET